MYFLKKNSSNHWWLTSHRNSVWTFFPQWRNKTRLIPSERMANVTITKQMATMVTLKRVFEVLKCLFWIVSTKRLYTHEYYYISNLTIKSSQNIVYIFYLLHINICWWLTVYRLQFFGFVDFVNIIFSFCHHCYFMTSTQNVNSLHSEEVWHIWFKSEREINITL